MLLDIDMTFIAPDTDYVYCMVWPVCLYHIVHVTPGYSFKLALLMIQFWFINVLI